MAGVEIDWFRWFIFAVLGVPLLVWLLATRNDIQRLLVVLAVLMFIQNVFVWRRTIIAFGIGPAVMLCYTAVVALRFHRGSFPRLGPTGLLWSLFLAAAMIGVVIGSIGTGLLFHNLYLFQEYYLEGLLFFVLGLMALRDDEEVRRFFFWFSLLIALGVALLHLFQLVSGWRPQGVEEAVAIGAYGAGKIENPGGVFPNPNTLGTFYVMTIPVVLMQILPGGCRGWRRAALGVAFCLMSMSLGLTTARGGALFSVILCGYTLWLAGFSVGRVLTAGTTLAVLLAAAWISAGVVLPDVRERIAGQLEEEGVRTGRFRTWLTFTEIAIEHPLGLGLVAAHITNYSRVHGTTLASAHNTFIDRAVRTGFFGLFAFLGLIGHITLRNLHAVRRARGDPEQRRAMIYLLLPILGFLVAGIVEPIYDNGSKINQLFWCLCGLSYAASARTLAAAAASPAATIEEGWRPLYGAASSSSST